MFVYICICKYFVFVRQIFVNVFVHLRCDVGSECFVMGLVVVIGMECWSRWKQMVSRNV